MKNYLAGKYAIVTGGTGGIGSEVTRLLRESECDVLSVSVDSEEKRCVVADRTGAEAVYLDVTDRDACMEILTHRNADILINASGALGRAGTLFDQTVASAQRLVNVNILGVQNCLEAVVPGMIERNDGHVVLIGSVALYPSLGQPIYSATKAAVHSMASNLRMELYPSRVRVTEYRPGRVRTGMHAEMFGGSHEEANQRVYDPVQTMAPTEAAEGIVWAVSQPPHLCVSQLEVLATEHVIGGVRYKGMPGS